MEKPTNSHQTQVTSQINLETVDLARIILEQFNNDYFRAIFEYTFQFIGLLSPEGILLEVNQTALNAIGLTKEDVIGKPFWETGWWLISPETQTQLQEAIASVCRKGETIQYQTEVWGENQTIIPVNFCLRPIIDESGKVILLIPEGWDLRQQKQIESEKLETEKKYRTLYEQVPVGIVYVDQNKNIIECNNYFCSLLGYTDTELTQKKITDITHPEDYNLHLSKWQDLWEGKIKQYSLENRYVRKNSTILWASVNVSNVQEENGNSYNVAIIQDITEQKQLEERYCKAQQIAKIGNWELNLQDNSFYWSDQIYEIFELDKRKTSPSYEGFLSLVYPEDREFVNEAYREHIEKGVPYNIVHRLLMKNGEIKYVREKCETYYDFHGKPIRSVGTTQDITEQREIENILSNIIDANTSSIGGAEFFPILVSHIANTLHAPYVLISRLDGDYLETLGFFAHGKIQDFYRYRWFGTPCECVISQGDLTCTQGIQQQFPHDIDLVHLNANSYVGIAIKNQNGEKTIGHICVLDEKKMTSAKIAQIKTILQVFAGRAGAEIERLEATQKIQKFNETLELKIALRTAQLEKKERENRLLKERLEYILAESPAIIYTCKTDGDYGATYMSPSITKITGYSPNQFTSQSDFWASKIHPEDKEKIFAEIYQLFEHDRHQHEYRYLHQDGHYIWVKDEMRLIKDSEGNLLEIIGYCADISDRKEAEICLNQQNQLLNIISKAQAQFITAQNRLTIFEELLSELLDLTDSEYGFIGEVLFSDDGSAVMEESFLKIRGIPSLKNHAVTDIAWNPETQKLYDENRQTGMEFNNMNTLFGAVIMTGKPVIANNPKMDLRSGGTPKGHPPLNAFLGLPFFNGTKLVGMIGIANRPDGYNQEIINYLQPLVITCANLIEGYRLDSQRKLVEIQLQQTNQELIRATRLKDEFVANMSHELRTPLNAILGLSEALQEQVYGNLNPQQLKYLKTIEDSGQHLLHLINDILDLAKIGSGNLELDLQPTAIVSVCDSSLIFVRQQALKKNINLKINYTENLKNLKTLIDERRIRQVLINLLNNAVKFTPEFGSITVDISLITEGTAVKIGVKDTGIGIAKEDLDNLFKPFVQVDSALNRKYNGTGLGLALVRKMVELHGGEVGVTSELGVGSYFYFCLPCQLEEKIETQLLEENNPDLDLNSSKSSFNPQNKRSCRILLVEDRDADILTITNYLQTKGYQIMTAKNGNSAFNLLQTEPIDLILMDISLPEMDGVETIRQIRLNSHLCKIPIIVLTASAMKGDREYYLQCGADEYLAKPVKLKQLLETISRYR